MAVWDNRTSQPGAEGERCGYGHGGMYRSAQPSEQRLAQSLDANGTNAGICRFDSRPDSAFERTLQTNARWIREQKAAELIVIHAEGGG